MQAYGTVIFTSIQKILPLCGNVWPLVMILYNKLIWCSDKANEDQEFDSRIG